MSAIRDADIPVPYPHQSIYLNGDEIMLHHTRRLQARYGKDNFQNMNYSLTSIWKIHIYEISARLFVFV